jgi:hypothetical protein
MVTHPSCWGLAGRAWGPAQRVTSLRRAIRSLARRGLAEVEPQRIDTGTVSRWTGWPVPRTMDAIRRADFGGRTPNRS